MLFALFHILWLFLRKPGQACDDNEILLIVEEPPVSYSFEEYDAKANIS